MRAAAENFFDIGTETDVEHSIGLVEDDDFQIAEFQGATSEMIENAAGRADDHFRAAAEFVDLATDRLAAIQGDRMCFAAVRQFHDFFANLHGELARRDQHQGLRTGVFFFRVELFQNWNGEGGGFARAGARLAQHVNAR